MNDSSRRRPFGWIIFGVALALVIPTASTARTFVEASPGDEDATFVPVTPCRLFDTRPVPATVGLRSSPLAAQDTHVQQVTGDNGKCAGIPSVATAVSLNVTIANPTAVSFLTVFPADVSVPPLSSNLNWTATSSPTPNKVDVKLSPDGKLKFFNNAGTVNLIADVVGYYTPASLTELAADVGALETRIAALESSVSVLDASMPFAASFSNGASVQLREVANGGFPTGGHTELARVTMTAPAAGTVVANFSGRTSTQVAPPNDTQFQCHLSDVDDTDELGLTDLPTIFFSVDSTTDEVPIAFTRGFDVAAGETITVYAFCRVTTDATPPSSVLSRDLTAIFTPDP